MSAWAKALWKIFEGFGLYFLKILFWLYIPKGQIPFYTHNSDMNFSIQREYVFYLSDVL